MTTQAAIGYGVLLKLGNAATPETFTTVAEVTSITPPGFSRDSVDVTHMQSTDRFREFIPGLIDAGEVSCELNYVVNSATTLLLMEKIEAAAGNMQIVWPGGSIMAFTGFLTNLEPEAPIDDKQAASVTIKVTGKPTLTQV